MHQSVAKRNYMEYFCLRRQESGEEKSQGIRMSQFSFLNRLPAKQFAPSDCSPADLNKHNLSHVTTIFQFRTQIYDYLRDFFIQECVFVIHSRFSSLGLVSLRDFVIVIRSVAKLSVNSSSKNIQERWTMVTNSLNLLVNQESDVMSLRSQRGRVTFCEEIEMDSLEPELFGKSGAQLGTIQEYEFNGRNIEDEFDDENLNEFREFDVSLSYETIKFNECAMCLSLCSESSEKLSCEVQLRVC